MKKQHILCSLFAVAALTLTACNEDFDDVAAPQAWEQEAAVTLPILDLEGKGNFEVDLAQAGDSVTLFRPTLSAALPEGATLENFRIAIRGKGGDESLNQEIKASAEGKVATAEVQAMAESFFGKRPEAHSYVMTVMADILVNGQASLVEATDNFVIITVAAPQISKEYYLIGAPSEWNVLNTTLKFNHSGKDVYDDPNFSIVFPVEDGECWFAITDSISINQNLADGSWSQVFGCAEGNGLNGTEGSVKRRADLSDDGSFKVEVAGDAKFIKVSLNMMDYTYKIEKLNFQEFIYLPGNHQGWTPATAPRLQSASFDGIYTGFSWLDGGFKFTLGPDWNYGEYNWGTFLSHPNGFTGEGGGDITCPEKAFYYVEADVAGAVLKATPTVWGIIGDATAGGWDSDQDMTWDADKGCWCATVTLTDGTIKFRANDGWDINFGGDPENLSAGGDNIPVTAGTYDIDLYLERTAADQFYCVITKK